MTLQVPTKAPGLPGVILVTEKATAYAVAFPLPSKHKCFDGASLEADLPNADNLL